MPNAMRRLNIVTAGTAARHDALYACQPGAAPGRSCLWLLGECSRRPCLYAVEQRPARSRRDGVFSPRVLLLYGGGLCDRDDYASWFRRFATAHDTVIAPGRRGRRGL